MRLLALTPLALVILTAAPIPAQDFLSPLEEMVDALADEIAPRRTLPTAQVEEPEPPPPVPRERPEDADEAPEDTPLPRPRPEEAAPAEPEAGSETEEEPSPVAVEDQEAAEENEPPRVYQSACPAVLMGLVEAEALPPIEEEGCGARSPLSVTGVLANGRMVPFSAPATLDCQMASTLPDWAETVDGYLMAREDTRLTEITVGTSYACRPRNNAQGADISEHGFANALDVAGFVLEDGRSVSVEEGWMPPGSAEGRLLRLAHDAACARFTTVLGPEANAQHEDHLHLDLGCHGAACTARLCE
jgi:hypothetical protein